MQRSYLLLPTAIAATMMLAACDRQDNQTAGQKVDQAIASAKSGTEEAKAAAERAAGTVATGAMDATITTKINAALVADDQLKAIKIDVDTKDGRVVLSGSAPDAAARDRATTLAKAVDGVVTVDNKLTIQPKS